MYSVMFRSSDRSIGWFKDSKKFDTARAAALHGEKEVEQSLASYRKCADAGVDVDYFVEYDVVPA